MSDFPPDTLYHYCGAHAFWSILKNHEIWLSSLRASNDIAEGKWLSTLLTRDVVETELNKSIWSSLLLMLSDAHDNLDCFGLCLSTDGDVLSQWRGYADDGCGFAIGFNTEFLSAQDEGRLARIRYTEQEQADLIHSRLSEFVQYYDRHGRPTLDEIEQRLNAIRRIAFDSLFLGLWDCPYLMKNPAFSEEQEWRYHSIGGNAQPTLSYRIRGNLLVPYFELPLPLDEVPVINRVVLGPKNPNSPTTVKNFVARYGFENVEVTRSSATYR